MSRLLSHTRAFYLQLGGALSTKARQVYLLALILDAIAAYGRDEMGVLASALAYYLLLSIFPLLILLISALTPFLANDIVVREAVRFSTGYFPASEREVRTILLQVIDARGPVTLFALIGLLWSSSGVFDLVQRGLNRAWHLPHQRPLWRRRSLSVVAVLVAGFLFASSIVLSGFVHSGARIVLQFGSAAVETVGLVVATGLNFVFFSVIYKVFPFGGVTYRQVWRGALIASILWEIAKVLFVVYLRNFARLSLVYGSIGAIIALLVWGYITSVILLFGAEITAIGSVKSKLGE